ncbi:hypothetical protein GJAV_G00258580 [Gymnothorax javanicus]|nr:hypothetical protein GJAV_G00258580 [Gymnothorax javanicus]
MRQVLSGDPRGFGPVWPAQGAGVLPASCSSPSLCGMCYSGSRSSCNTTNAILSKNNSCCNIHCKPYCECLGTPAVNEDSVFFCWTQLEAIKHGRCCLDSKQHVSDTGNQTPAVLVQGLCCEQEGGRIRVTRMGDTRRPAFSDAKRPGETRSFRWY